MKRRGFLGLFGKAAAAIVAAPVLAKIPEVSHLSGEELRDIRLKTYGTAKSFDSEAEMYEGITGHSSFGLAQVKQEGTSVTYGTSEIFSNQEIDFSEYELIQKRRAECLAESMRKTKETVASDVYHSVFGIDR